MHGDQSLMTMDATMFGKQPKLSSSSTSRGSNIVHDGIAKHGYLSAFYWIVNDQDNSARTDSQSKCMIPTVEIIIHNNDKSGVPANLLEQANAAAMFLLQRALKSVKNLLPGANLPRELGCRYVEADNGLAERLSSAKTFGRYCILLRERWHTKECAFNFIDDMKKDGVFSEYDEIHTKRIINTYFHAMSSHAAEKAKDHFFSYFEKKLLGTALSSEMRQHHKTHYTNSVGTTVFKYPIEVCDYGRKHCAALKVSSGPISETLNSVMKNEIGDYIYFNPPVFYN